MTAETSTPSMSVHVPITLLALAIAVFLGAQIGAASRNGKTSQWQLGNLAKQKTNLEEAQKRQAEELVRREERVKQADQIQSQYMAIFNDVLELSKDDDDAKRIVQKWGIQRQGPPPGAAAATGDAKPAAPAATP